MIMLTKVGGERVEEAGRCADAALLGIYVCLFFSCRCAFCVHAHIGTDLSLLPFACDGDGGRSKKWVGGWWRWWRW